MGRPRLQGAKPFKGSNPTELLASQVELLGRPEKGFLQHEYKLQEVDAAKVWKALPKTPAKFLSQADFLAKLHTVMTPSLLPSSLYLVTEQPSLDNYSF